MQRYEKQLWIAWGLLILFFILPSIIGACAYKSAFTEKRASLVLYSLFCLTASGFLMAVQLDGSFAMYAWLIFSVFQVMTSKLTLMARHRGATAVALSLATIATSYLVAETFLSELVSTTAEVLAIVLLTFVCFFLFMAIASSPALATDALAPPMTVSFVLYMVLVGIFVAFNLYRLEPPEIGTVVASNVSTGATVRRQLIFHLQDDDGSPMPLRNWTLLDPDEKIRVKMEFKGPDVVPLRYRDDKSIEKSNWVYMDVERKGQGRAVPNLNMECLEQDKDDGKKFDGQDCQFFEVLDEYEDWWVTFGYPADPLHFRQMVANELRLTPSVLVDVYTQHSPKLKTYEGVGLMVPAFKKDHYLNSFGDGDRNGNLKCDDGELETEKPPLMLAKFDKGNVNNSWLMRTFTDRAFKDMDFKQLYPKQNKIDDKCSAEVAKEVKEKYTDVLTGRVNETDFKKIMNENEYSVKEFIDQWIFEMLLQDTDFAFRSQYFALFDRDQDDDDVTTMLLGPGPLWDFNAAGYRGRSATETFRLTNMYPFIGWDKPWGIFDTICSNHTDFVAYDKSTLKNAIQHAKQVIYSVNEKFTPAVLTQLNESFHVRNKMTSALIGDPLDVNNNALISYYFKENVTAERDFQYNRFARRIAYIENEIATTDCTVEKKHASVMLMSEVVFLLIALLVYVYYLVYCCCTCKKDDEYSLNN